VLELTGACPAFLLPGLFLSPGSSGFYIPVWVDTGEKEFLNQLPLYCLTVGVMAGAVRQPIDIPSLERYLDQNVPIIKTPIDVKQVSPQSSFSTQLMS
jgi:hypothetical protein